MKVNLLTGLLGGGAANAAKQLHAGLRKRGVDASLLYPGKLKSVGPAEEYTPVTWNTGGLQRLTDAVRFRMHRESFKRKVRDRARGMEVFTSPRGAACTPWPPRGHQTDASEIIHLHWVAKFIDYQSFFRSLPAEQIVVWTLHDMNPFTGGCHFTNGCERFTSGCGSCPQLPVRFPEDISHNFFRIKQQSLRDVNLHIVTASRWMQENARRSPIFQNVRSYHRIPYGLPMHLCQPVERLVARAELGIDPNAFVFAFGAMDLENQRKGSALLMAALQHIADLPNVLGLVLGGGELPKTSTPLPPLRSMGFIKEIQRRIFLYSACDVFILPSTQDNMPLTGLEALASGIPIIGFDAGGIPDFVRPHETGLLAPLKDPHGLTDAPGLGLQIRYLATHRDEAVRLGQRAREVAGREYSEEREADDYIQLYKKLQAGDFQP